MYFSLYSAFGENHHISVFRVLTDFLSFISARKGAPNVAGVLVREERARRKSSL